MRAWKCAMVVVCSLNTTNVYGSIDQRSCKQTIYDAVYRQIILNVENDLSHEVFEERNHAIRTLRELCHGQKSTFETKKEGQDDQK